VLENPIGSGRLAEVWQAREPLAARHVAVKIFFDRVMQQFEMIRGDCKKQASIEHERVVPIYYCHLDPEDSPGPYYIVTKLMQGSLAGLLRRRPKLPLDEALPIIRDLIEGLTFAHDANIIYREIKPANILFDSAGRAALADFGIAKYLTKSEGTNVLGTLMGTPEYMSPEQGEGRPLTKASDIYSLGAVFYEMLAGKAPFDGPTDDAIIIARAKHDPPPLRQWIPEIPERLELVILRCLDRDVKHRYPDCDSLTRALDWATKAPPAPPNRNVRR